MIVIVVTLLLIRFILINTDTIGRCQEYIQIIQEKPSILDVEYKPGCL